MDLRPRARTNGVSEPTLASALIFRVKTAGLRWRRRWQNLMTPVRRHVPRDELRHAKLVAESVTPLRTDLGSADPLLTEGKIENLRRAVRRIDGVELRPGDVFSFWAQVGRATRWRGYRRGRELREGCLVPSIGGGLCQLSNALYDAALKAGLEIVERHAHTRVIPGSLAEQGRDATIFWNYVDLRFRADAPLRIEARLGPADLVVRFRRAELSRSPAGSPAVGRSVMLEPSGSCDTCDNTQCFRKEERGGHRQARPDRVYLLDERWPEFEEVLRAQAGRRDLVFVSQPPRQPFAARGGWNEAAGARFRGFRSVPIRRALALRRLAEQGEARQRSLLGYSERLSHAFARALPWDAGNLVLSQGLLPFLWRDGVLGGRTFEVWMTRLPLYALQGELDRAAVAHPQSRTLADFRVDDQLVEYEREALAAAARVVTPHARIAALFADRVDLLPWCLPTVSRPSRRGRALVVPASTLGRKGAYLLRSAMRALDYEVEIRVLGRELEGPGFWDGLAVSHGPGGPAGLEGAAVVVLPAYVEHQPRALLAAAAAGVPVIASEACGLHDVGGVITIPTGDAEALADAADRVLRASAPREARSLCG
jgi:hypothetical protein